MHQRVRREYPRRRSASEVRLLALPQPLSQRNQGAVDLKERLRDYASPGVDPMRRKAALQQAIETLEGLDQVRRRVKKLEKHLQISLLHVKMIERELGLDEPPKKR